MSGHSRPQKHLMPPPHIAALVGSERLPQPIQQRLRAARERIARRLLETSFSPEWLASKGVKPGEELQFALRYVPTVLCGEDWWSDPARDAGLVGQDVD